MYATIESISVSDENVEITHTFIHLGNVNHSSIGFEEKSIDGWDEPRAR